MDENTTTTLSTPTDEYPADCFEPNHEKSVEDIMIQEEKMEILPIDLTLEEIGTLALKAHEADMKLNDFIVRLLVDYANEVIDEQEQLDLGV